MRKLLAAILFIALGSATAIHAQSSWGKPHARSFRFFSSPIGTTSLFVSRGRPGLRLLRPHRFAPRRLPLVDTRPSGFLDRTTLYWAGFHRGSRDWVPSTSWSWGIGGGAFPGPSPTSTWPFVEKWRERPPASKKESSLAASSLLQEGMGEAEVMGRLGSPLARVERGEKVLWTYSGYRLVFFEGRLSGLE